MRRTGDEEERQRVAIYIGRRDVAAESSVLVGREAGVVRDRSVVYRRTVKETVAVSVPPCPSEIV